jgi:type II secretory pathway pseudopilin PulG
MKEVMEMRSNTGMTLVEIMVAMLLGMLVLAAIVAVQMMSTRTFAEGTTDAMLERTGNSILERIVRGPAGQYGLREARFSTVTISGGATPVLTYMVDRNDPPTFDTSDDTECAIYLSPTGLIVYDPDTSVGGDEVNLNSEAIVSTLNMTKNDTYVEIELILQHTVRPFDSAIQVRVSTCVQPRVD